MTGTLSASGLVTASNGLRVGTAGSVGGVITLAHSGDANTTTFQAANTASTVTFTLPGTDGSNNQVLTTNGSGTLTFASPSVTAVTGILPAANGGTGNNNAGNIAVDTNVSITGGGTLALSGKTLTVPSTGTAALLQANNAFTGSNSFSQQIAAAGITSTGDIVTTGAGAITSAGLLTGSNGLAVTGASNIGTLNATATTVTTLNASGLITGTAGATITGAPVNLNADSPGTATNFAVNISSGNTTGTVTIGNAANTVVFNAPVTNNKNVNMSTNVITSIGNAGTNFLANGGLTLANALTVSAGGASITGATTVAGTLTATAFSGNGSALTNLNASNLASGTVPLAQLSGITTAQLDPAAGITNGQLAHASITINTGSGLLGGGTVALGGTLNLSADPTAISLGGDVIGTASANTIAHTAQAGTNIVAALNNGGVAGTIPDARLTNNVALLNATNAFTGVNTFVNSTLGFKDSAVTVHTTTIFNTNQTQSGTLTIPALPASGSDTLATLGVSQTFSAANTFSAAGTALTVNNGASIGTLTVSGTSNVGVLNAGNTAVTGTLSASGLVTAGGVTLSSGVFTGSGAGLTNVPDSALSGNVATLTGTQTFTGAKTFNAVVTAANGVTLTGGVFTGSGAGLTNVPDSALSGNVATLTGTQTFTGAKTFNAVVTAANGVTLTGGAFTGSGAGLTNVPAGSLTGANTLPDGVLSTNVALLNAANTFTNGNSIVPTQAETASLSINQTTGAHTAAKIFTVNDSASVSYFNVDFSGKTNVLNGLSVAGTVTLLRRLRSRTRRCRATWRC